MSIGFATSRNGDFAGQITVSGVSHGTRLVVGDIVTASNNFTDPDADISGVTVTYHWWRDGVQFLAGNQYTIAAGDVGHDIKVTAAFTHTEIAGSTMIGTFTSTQFLTPTYASEYEVAGLLLGTVNSNAVGVNDTAHAQEDSTSDLSVAAAGVLGNDTDTDADPLTVSEVNGSGANVGVAVVGAHGTLTLNSDGSYTYHVDDTDPAVNVLKAGESVADSFTYAVTDGFGGSSTATLKIVIDGHNDAPDVSNHTGTANAAGATVAASNATGNVLDNATDAESAVKLDLVNGASVTVTGVAQQTFHGAHGDLHITDDGAYSYVVNAADTAVLALQTGDTPLHDTFSFVGTDGSGGTDVASLVITVNGVNDAPMANDFTLTATAVTSWTVTQKAGDVTVSDVDGDTVLVTQLGADLTPTVNFTTNDAHSGHLSMTPGGHVMYDLHSSNADIIGLGVGESIVESFSYHVSDGNGGTDIANITIKINGVNDGPGASNAAADVYANTANFTSSIVSITDPDANDTPTVYQVNGDSTPMGAWFTLTDAYGTFWMTTQGSYSYSADTSLSSVQSLAQGETATDTFTYHVTDHHGGTDTATVTITIHGVNDGPTGVDDSGSATEAGTAAGSNATGNVLTNDTDPDHLDTKTVSDVTGTAAGTVGGATAGNYGTLTLNADGTYSYAVNDADGTVNALNVGGSVTDSFTYTVVDALGASSTATLTVTIHGANDAASIGGVATGSVSESGALSGGTPSATGTLTDTDVDNPANTFQAVGTPTASDGGYGTYTVDASGNWQYHVNNGNSAVNALNQTQTLTDTFSVLAEDGTSQTVTITINGADDFPGAVNDTASATEAGTAAGVNPAGNVLTNDSAVDNGDTVVVDGISGGALGVPKAGNYGSLTLNSDGTFSYAVNNANSTVDALRLATDMVTDTFQFLVGDTAGNESLETLTVTIHGANDGPVANTDAGSATEGGVAAAVNATGNVLTNDTDVDAGDTKTVSAITGGTVGVAHAGTYGSVTLNADGTYTYVVNDANATVDALRVAGDTVTDTFTYTMTDTAGATSTSTLTVTVHGANDAPVGVDDAGSATEAGIAAGSDATGNVLTNDTDVDAGDTKAVSAISGGTLGVAHAGNYGSLTLNADGTYTYVVNDSNPTVQALLLNTDTVTDSFTYTVSDTAGGTDTATVTITIHGADDAPVANPDTGSVNEGTLASPTSHVAGTVNFTDVDDAAHVVAIAAQTSSLAASLTATGDFGKLIITASGAWGYDVFNGNPTVDQLNITDTLTDTFYYQVDDGHGGSDLESITITIHGVNDPATFTGDFSGGVTESGGLSNSISGNSYTWGTVNVHDVDNSESLQFQHSNASHGQWWAWTSGSWSYTLDNSDLSVEGLNVGQTLTDTFTIHAADGTAKTITVTIHGANDAATFSGTSHLTATEAGGLSNSLSGDAYVAGVLNIHDVDNAQQVVADSGTGDLGYGYFSITASGAWNFSLDNGNATVEALNSATHITDTFTVHAVDGTTKQLSVEIWGQNDAATFTGSTSGDVSEDGGVANAIVNAHNSTGHLSVHDVDNADLLQAVPTGTATYGQYHVAATGNWSYVLDSTNATVEALAAGQSMTDTFTVHAADGTAQTVTIVVHGANDAPVAVADTASATESGTAAGTDPTGNVLTNDTDVDSGDTKTVSAISGGTVGVAKAGSHGSLTLNADGTFTYAVNNGDAAVDALRLAGDTLTDTFTYTVADAGGESSSTTLTVTIHGANDAPIANTDAGSATEGGTAAAINATGNVLTNDTDVDSGDTKTVSAITGGTVGSSLAGTYGSITLNANGTYTYVVNDANGTVDALRVAGDTLTDTFTYTMTDTAGATSSSTVTVTIHGSNDAPVAVADTASATEAGTSAGTDPTGNVLTNDTDVDAGDTKTVSAISGGTLGVAKAGSHGSLTLNADGTYSYAVNNADAAVDALRLATDTLTDTFTYTVVDTAGATSSTTLTVTIHGANDAPIANTDAGSATEGGTAAAIDATGNVLTNDTDVDSGDTKTVSAITGGTVGSSLAGTYGSVTLNANGTYTYVVNDANGTVDALRLATDTLTDSFTYTMTDTAGATSTSTLTVTIHGSNDAPVANADTGSATEGGTAAPIDATGNVLTNDTDVDAGDTKTVTGIAGGVVGSTKAGTYGSITLNANGTYTYAVNDANGTVDALRLATDTLTDTFTYTVTDTAGATSSSTITVTIHGSNDAPVAVADTASATEAGTAAGVDPTGNVLTNDTDVDAGDSKTVSAISGGTLGVAKAGSHGSLTLNADGTFSYAVNNGDAAVDALRQATDTLTDTFTYTMTDTAGATSSTTLTVTIHGANDAPIANADTGSATEGGTAAAINATGNVLTNDTDVDTGDTKTVSAITGGTVGSSLAGTYGSITLNANGTYTYVVNDANGTVDALRLGTDTLTDTFTYTMTDTAGATSSSTITVTIHGSNDAPVANADAGSATEGGTAAAVDATGNVLTNDTDVDSGDTQTVTAISGGTVGVAKAGTYGSVTLNSDGTYTYVVNDANGTVDALRLATDTLTDTFTYTVTDTAGATATASLTVTIHGSNDAPVANTDAASATESGTAAGVDPSGNVLTNDTDVDAGDTKTVSAISGGTLGSALAGNYGSITLNADGTFSYAVDNSNGTVDALRLATDTLTDTFTYTMTDTAGATSSSTVTVTIHGANDAPIGVDDTGSATEAGAAAGSNATGNVLTNDTDVDAGDGKSVSGISGGTVGSSLAGTYGSITLNADGTFTYVVNDANGTVDALRLATDTLTDTFTYTVSDTAGATDTATVTVTIHGANDTPIANADTASATEIGTNVSAGMDPTGNVLTNDTDVDAGDTKTVSAISGGTLGSALAGSWGSVTLNADGTYSYVVDNANTTVDHLAIGETLTDTFTYTMTDTAGATSTSTLTVTVHGANDAPIGNTDAASATESGTSAGHTAVGDLLANDSDVDNGHVLSVADVNVSAPTADVAGNWGSLHVTTAGAYTYSVDDLNATVDGLALGETLIDTFTYVVQDEYGATSSSTLTITVNGANDAPVALDDTGTATEAGVSAGAVATGDVLANDSDVDHLAALSVTYTDSTGNYGTLHLDHAGHYTYSVSDLNPTVDALSLGETLIDTFNYTVYDEHGASDLASITITVVGANDGPLAFNDYASATEAGVSAGVAAVGNLLSNDTDVDAHDTHQVVNVSGQAFTVMSSTQSFTYSYTYTGTSVSATQTYTYTNTYTNYYTSPTSSISVVGSYGELDVTISGDYTFIIDDLNLTVDALALGETLTESFVYTMTDNHGATDVATVVITINGANDAPVASDDTAQAMEAGASNNGYYWYDNVLVNDSDVDNGASINVIGVDGSSLAGTNWFYGSHGWLEMFSNGDYYYYVNNSDVAVDALGPSGTLQDFFSYTIADEHGATSVANIGVTIHGQNDAPTGSVTISGAAFQGQTLSAFVNLADPEGIATGYSYQWQADGSNIGTGASTYTLTAADLGKTISVIVSYTDGGGTLESVTGSIVTHPGIIATGSGGADHLVGSSGDDSLNGGLGKDRMEGLDGNDTYMVDNSRDLVIELPGQGIDTVIASLSFTLGANVENLTLTGVGNFFAKGNALDNVLIGNSGKNAIYGYGGQDTLTGGGGADTFYFTPADVASHDVVTITDFSVAQGDKISFAAIDAKEGMAGNQAFRFIGTDSFSSYVNLTGLLRFDTASGMLIGSTNADGSHIVQVQLVGIDHLGTDAGGIDVHNIVL